MGAPNDSPEGLVEIHRTLCAEYGCPIAYFHTTDPLDELISTMLNHRTTNRHGSQAFKALRAKYADWNDLADAPTADVEAAIPMVTWPEQKAPRVQHALRAIREERGELSLAFLADLPVPEARAWLERIPGVGPKTSAAALSFSQIRGRALPVDSHHHRVAARLGMIGPKVDVGASHAILEARLPEDWSAQDVYDHHQVMMRHGKRVCLPRPECARCVLNDRCPSRRSPRRSSAPDSAEAPSRSDGLP